MDKPIYIGTSILDLSKSLMYDYYYNNLKSKYKDNVSLLYMDTDSFILEIKTSDVYEDMIDNIDIVANSRPPACDRPRTSNRNRVAHRSDNSVVTLLEQSPETSHGWVVNLTTAQSAFYPREIGSLAEYQYT